MSQISHNDLKKRFLNNPKQGVNYDSSVTYKTGDIISYNDAIYIVGAIPPIAGTLPTDPSFSDIGPIGSSGGEYFVSNITPTNTSDDYPNTISETQGAYWIISGLAVDTSYTYTDGGRNGQSIKNGDKLLYNGAGADTAGTGIAIIPAVSTSWGGIAGTLSTQDDLWTALKGREYIDDGGVAPFVNYVVGDICSESGTAYLCTASTTGTFTPASWTAIGTSEKGGITWDINSYVIGDTVSEDGNLYICNAVHTSVNGDNVLGSPSQPLQTSWDLIGSDELGGRLYDNTLTYAIGDIVSDGLVPAKVYIAVRVSTGIPVTTLDDWQELNPIWYDTTAGTHTPTAGTEMPDTTGEIVGAIWYINGLGYNPDGTKIPYIMVGGELTGAIVNDDDRFIWVSGISGSEVWLHIKAAGLSGNRGGILYNSKVSYLIGDVVTFGGLIYTCISDTVLTTDPSVTPSEWSLVEGAAEVAGRAYSATNDYAIGDIVIGTDNVIFRAITGGVGKALPGSGVAFNADWSSDTQFDPGTYS